MKCCGREEDEAEQSINFMIWKTTGKIMKLMETLRRKLYYVVWACQQCNVSHQLSFFVSSAGLIRLVDKGAVVEKIIYVLSWLSDIMFLLATEGDVAWVNLLCAGGKLLGRWAWETGSECFHGSMEGCTQGVCTRASEISYYAAFQLTVWMLGWRTSVCVL